MSNILDLPLEERAAEERKRQALAPAFDRLVDSNLALTTAVGQLVRACYVVVALETASVLYHLVWHKPW